MEGRETVEKCNSMSLYGLFAGRLMEDACYARVLAEHRHLWKLVTVHKSDCDVWLVKCVVCGRTNLRNVTWTMDAPAVMDVAKRKMLRKMRGVTANVS